MWLNDKRLVVLLYPVDHNVDVRGDVHPLPYRNASWMRLPPNAVASRSELNTPNPRVIVTPGRGCREDVEGVGQRAACQFLRTGRFFSGGYPQGVWKKEK
jgi:hypothetical protein